MLTDLSRVRTLFTQDSLGITAYASNRDLELTYCTHPEQFKDEFRQNIEKTVPLSMLVDNMKRYLHIFGARTQDVELLWKSLRLFRTQYEQWQRKSQLDVQKNYIFGPIVMRALSYHDLPEYAIQVNQCPLLHEFVNCSNSSKICVSLCVCFFSVFRRFQHH